jgi:hypothetical protein
MPSPPRPSVADWLLGNTTTLQSLLRSHVVGLSDAVALPVCWPFVRGPHTATCARKVASMLERAIFTLE